MSGYERIDVAEGKYTVLLLPTGKTEALRYGKAWPAYPNGLNNIERALAVEIVNIRMQHHFRVTELLAANNVAVEKRREACGLLREVEDWIPGDHELGKRIEDFLAGLHKC